MSVLRCFGGPSDGKLVLLEDNQNSILISDARSSRAYVAEAAQPSPKGAATVYTRRLLHADDGNYQFLASEAMPTLAALHKQLTK